MLRVNTATTTPRTRTKRVSLFALGFLAVRKFYRRLFR